MQNLDYDIIFYYKEQSSAQFFKNTYDFFNALESLNTAILGYVSKDIKAKIQIQSLEQGSLKAKLKDIIKNVDDSTLRQYVNKSRDIFADLLIKAKHSLIKILSYDPKVIPQKVEPAIINALNETGLSPYGYTSNKTELLKSLSELSKTSNNFKHTPQIRIKGDTMNIDSIYEFSPDDLDNIITQKSQIKSSFIIKKPDLAGTSKWSIIHDKAIDVKLIDEAWLSRLKHHEITLGYGDRIVGTLITENFIDKNFRSNRNKLLLR